MALTLWFTGLSGAGKTTLARALKIQLELSSCKCVLLDGDELRSGLCKDLGFSDSDRSENIRRVAQVAALLNSQGYWVIVALISPREDDRIAAKNIIGSKKLCLIYVCTNLAICESRDAKGLYARARQGRLFGLTGIDAPYEAPAQYTVSIDTSLESTEYSISRLLSMLQNLYIDNI